jgi:hypothetical protein
LATAWDLLIRNSCYVGRFALGCILIGEFAAWFV